MGNGRVKKIRERLEQVMTQLGSDPRFAKDIITALAQRGVYFEADKLDHCVCFPRSKKSKKLLGLWTCMQCKKQMSIEADRKMFEKMRKNVLMVPA